MERIIIDRNIEIPLRDGVITRADIYRPDTAGKHPAILVRLPYSKDEFNLAVHLDPMRAVKAGYIVIIQDTRGQFMSDGEFDPLFSDIEDGYDSVEWVAEQAWCTGKVGLFGPSYLSMVQWLAAKEAPPHLNAMIPVVSPSDHHDSNIYQGGAFNIGFALQWAYALSISPIIKGLSTGKTTNEELNAVLSNLNCINERIKIRPYKDAVDKNQNFYLNWISHPCYDEYWKKVDTQQFISSLDVPVFNVGAWYDVFLKGTLDNYNGIGEKPAAANKLLIGPWSHGDSYAGNWPEWGYVPQASHMAVGMQQQFIRFFDFWLKGEKNDLDKELPVQLYIMGENQWKSYPSWPLPNTDWTEYHLHSSGNANTLNDDGILSVHVPANEPEDKFMFDPINPVVTSGGQTLLAEFVSKQGPIDQRRIEERADVLCYTGDELAEPLTIIGPVKARLFVSSSAKDTDFTAKLIDVQPDGRALILTEGVLRVRYRNSQAVPEMMEPGKVYEIEIDMWGYGEHLHAWTPHPC